MKKKTITGIYDGTGNRKTFTVADKQCSVGDTCLIEVGNDKIHYLLSRLQDVVLTGKTVEIEGEE